MKVEFRMKKFSEIKNGEIFIHSPKSETLVIKIEPCKNGERDMNSIRLDDGKLFWFGEEEIVYPVSCVIIRHV